MLFTPLKKKKQKKFSPPSKKANFPGPYLHLF
ncbi:MAG: hypothetical protein MRERV_7c010 [Mycoplasmataceae bacterium RV_VA103A]|nr:MAG: hypothetical protein MRERV_7c010 [Mycoplasmataceae bacterium RV_VA103A]